MIYYIIRFVLITSVSVPCNQTYVDPITGEEIYDHTLSLHCTEEQKSSHLLVLTEEEYLIWEQKREQDPRGIIDLVIEKVQVLEKFE